MGLSYVLGMGVENNIFTVLAFFLYLFLSIQAHKRPSEPLYNCKRSTMPQAHNRPVQKTVARPAPPSHHNFAPIPRTMQKTVMRPEPSFQPKWTPLPKVMMSKPAPPTTYQPEQKAMTRSVPPLQLNFTPLPVTKAVPQPQTSDKPLAPEQKAVIKATEIPPVVVAKQLVPEDKNIIATEKRPEPQLILQTPPATISIPRKIYPVIPKEYHKNARSVLCYDKSFLDKIKSTPVVPLKSRLQQARISDPQVKMEQRMKEETHDLAMGLHEFLLQYPYGVMEKSLPDVFQKTTGKSLPDEWSKVILAANSSLFCVDEGPVARIVFATNI